MGSFGGNWKIRFQLERDVCCGTFDNVDGNEVSVNMIKRALAVITLLKEVAGLDTNVVSGFVIQEACQESVSFG